MTELILLLSLTPAAAPAPVATPDTECLKTRNCVAAAKTDYEICLYPKKCAPKKAEAAPIIGPCVAPRVCREAAPVVAQFQPCVWPNRCSGRREGEALFGLI